MSETLEKEFLKKFLLSSTCVTEVLEKRIDASFVADDINRKLFEIALWYYNKYSAMMTGSSLSLILSKSRMPDEAKQKLTLLFAEVQSAAYEDKPLSFIIDQLRHNFKKTKLKQVLVSSVNSLEQQQVDKAISDLRSGVADIELAGKEDIREGFLDESGPDRLKRYYDVKDHPEKYRGIHIGWPSFDETTNGVRGGQLMVIIAAVKEGKSTALLNIAYNAHISGKNVLYVSVEMPKEQIERRYDTRDSQLSYSRIRDGKLNSEEEEIYKQTVERQKHRPGRFYIIDAHDCNTTFLKSKIKTFHHKIDLVVIDYLTLVTPSRKGRDLWETIGKTTEEVRAIAREMNIPIITAAQANREGIKDSKKYKYNVENIGLSHLISAHADVLLSLRLADRDELEINDVVEMNAATIAIRDDRGCRFIIDACFDKMLMTERRIDLFNSPILNPSLASQTQKVIENKEEVFDRNS